MKTLGILLGSLLLSSAAVAGTGPDFVAAPARPHIDKSLVASSGTRPIEPGDVVQFAPDKAVLTESGYSQVDRAALWLKTHPRLNIVLEGHADAPGSEGYNASLSMLRAEAVRTRLVKDGIAKKRILMIARGEQDDIDSPADRRVRMYATNLAPVQVYAMIAPKPSETAPTQTATR